jgi:DNA-binding transcriptional LysR family regulator
MMSSQQVRSLCAVVECGFSISRAAAALHTTQPAVSKTVKAVEADLGGALFERSSTKITGLTDLGVKVFELSRGILRDLTMVRELAQERSRGSHAQFTIGTTHTHARYLLPQIIERFARRHPHVSIRLDEGHSCDVVHWVKEGRVSLGLCASGVLLPAALASLPGRRTGRCIIAPLEHELSAARSLDLAELSRYPLVALDQRSSAGAEIRRVFAKHGLGIRVAVEVSNPSAVKACVTAGVGIGIIDRAALEHGDERRFSILRASRLFPAGRSQLILRRSASLRPYIYEFLETVWPAWTEASVSGALRESRRRPPPATARARKTRESEPRSV